MAIILGDTLLTSSDVQPRKYIAKVSVQHRFYNNSSEPHVAIARVSFQRENRF